MPQSVYLNGSFYASSVLDYISNPTFIKEDTVGYLTNYWSSFEIDYTEDFMLCEIIMNFLLSSSNYHQTSFQ